MYNNQSDFDNSMKLNPKLYLDKTNKTNPSVSHEHSSLSINSKIQPEKIFSVGEFKHDSKKRK